MGSIPIREWVQYAFVMATAMEKMGVMATGGGVHTATATENKKD